MEHNIYNSGIQPEVFKELCDTIGRENIVGSIKGGECYFFDTTKENSTHGLVARPHSTKQVSNIVSIAEKYNIPVFIRGGGAGMSKRSVYIEDGISLDLKNMNCIEDLNARDLTVTVEPGVVAKDLQNEAAKFSLFYPYWSGSNVFSTIGESVAECTGGMAGMKHGVTRDYVLALEIVLPDGSIINTGRKTLKSVAGYDLTRFFVGSEGTLGVLTKITLKLLPMPEKRCTIMSYFKDIDSALNVTDSILIKNHLHPCSLGFADKAAIAAARDSIEGISEEAEAMLFIDIDGNEKNVVNDVSVIDSICRENSTLKTSVTNTDEERNTLWNISNSVSPFLFNAVSCGFEEDFTVPGSRVREVLKKVYELSRVHSLQVALFGNIGEGHIHLSLYGNGEEGDASANNLLSEILKGVVRIGGNIVTELAPHEIEIMKDMKNMFDPKGIMNPGKLLIRDGFLSKKRNISLFSKDFRNWNPHKSEEITNIQK
ncbi:dehydrogenase [Candidatus Scalindua japonica]|uniref:Dehydrogenase n=1 Tax=Candidatus Scalindua japonica TaxID=1284222 RepID=A0A286U3X4_9BACT|nr:FAD-linked oxidase C-terminal domain-containing protein [Candidatus Scalindua japonica]GAX62839.1 dehydrogenase [Candidatus Scalindua japonica]